MPFLRSIIAHKSSKRGKATALTDKWQAKALAEWAAGAKTAQGPSARGFRFFQKRTEKKA
jgi:hypothetical protein